MKSAYKVEIINTTLTVFIIINMFKILAQSDILCYQFLVQDMILIHNVFTVQLNTRSMHKNNH